MNLFGDEDVLPYDSKIQFIVNGVARKLTNQNKDYSRYKCYSTACEILTSIYDGTFKEKYHFNGKHFKDFNMVGVEDVIASCKGDYQKIRDLTVSAVSHLYLAKEKAYLPWNKKYLAKVTFSNFFQNITNDGRCESLFYMLINEPLKQTDYFQDVGIKKIKNELDENNFKGMREVGERIEKRFTDKKDKFLFWSNIEELYWWWRDVKKFLPNVYSELKYDFTKENLLQDYYEWLCENLYKQYGANFVLEPYHFKIGDDEFCLKGSFLMYMNMLSRKHKILGELPRNIKFYYKTESFHLT